MALQFDESVKQRVPQDHQALLLNFEEIAKVMHDHSANNKFVWNLPNDPKLLLNHYLDILWVVHICKFSELCQALIDAVNRQEFIVYGLIGRALIEHAAVMRYYFKHRIQSAVDEAVQTGSISTEQIRKIVSELDQFLRGSRFNWEAFLTGKFDELLDEKKDITMQTQINVLTCLQKWEKETPQIMVLYKLFCDLVHPNVGSTLLIMKKWTEGVGFGGQDGEPVGEDVFIWTLAGLVALFRDIQIYLEAMLLLQIHDEK